MYENKRRYSVNGDDPVQNNHGNDSGMTYSEAFNEGLLTIVDDEIDGSSHGLHGHLYTK